MTRRVPTPTTVAGKFRRDVKLLKEMMPPLFPVRVYRRRLEGCLGYCELTRRKDGSRGFVIAVDSGLSWDATWQVLLHEWAHALSWQEGQETFCDHGPEWALALGRVYQETTQV